MQWYLDRLGSANDLKAARCTWMPNTLSISIPEQFLRADNVNITKMIDELAIQFKSSYTVSGEFGNRFGGAYSNPNGNTLTFRMIFPWNPGAGDLEEISAVLGSLMFGCPAAVSKGSVMPPDNEAIKPTELIQVKGNNYQEMYDQIMREETPLSEMDLKEPGSVAAYFAEVAKPFIGMPNTETNRTALKTALQQATGNKTSGFMPGLPGYLYPIYQAPLQVQGYPNLQKQSPIDVGALKAYAQKQQSVSKRPEPTKDTDSPTAVELATLEYESLDREC